MILAEVAVDIKWLHEQWLDQYTIYTINRYQEDYAVDRVNGLEIKIEDDIWVTLIWMDSLLKAKRGTEDWRRSASCSLWLRNSEYPSGQWSWSHGNDQDSRCQMWFDVYVNLLILWEDSIDHIRQQIKVPGKNTDNADLFIVLQDHHCELHTYCIKVTLVVLYCNVNKTLKIWVSK